MRKLSRFWWRFSHFFSRTPLHPQYLIRLYMYKDIKESSKYASGLLMDIGSGDKPYLPLFSPKIRRYISLDHLKKVNDGDQYQRSPLLPDIYGDILNLPLKDACADTILLTQVIEHTCDPLNALKESARVLKGGGIMILSFPHIHPVHCEPDDYFRFTPYGIRYILKKNDLEILESHPMGGYPFFLIQSICLYLTHKVRDLYRSGGAKGFLGVALAPILIFTSLLVNLLYLPFKSWDKESRFTMNYLIIAKKIPTCKVCVF